MRRREFITLVGGAAFAWSLAARGQPALPVIGMLNSGSEAVSADRLRAFRQGLGDAGFVEGRNVMIEYRWAEDQNDRLPRLAADLVQRQVNVIAAATGLPAALAAKAATTSIPVVFQMGSDPVEAGVVASFNRPGGNLTGVVNLNVELGPKRLELLHELLPNAKVIAVLINPTSPTAESLSARIEASARILGLQLRVVHASGEDDVTHLIDTWPQMQSDALLITPDPVFTSRAEQIAALTLLHSVPAIYQYHEFAAAGGLMSYGGSIADNYRQSGIYAGRILKGEKPADMAIALSTKVELYINLKTAKTLGINVPVSMLARADEVIE